MKPEKSVPPVSEMSEQKRRRIVLIVDDSIAHRRLLEVYLSSADYEIIEASNINEAIEACRNQQPDFVLSEVSIAATSGTELCQRIRALPSERYTYFILLTSRANPADIARGLESGADDFMTKPTSSAELLARLRAADRILTLQEESKRANKQLLDTLTELRSTQEAMDHDLSEARRLQQGLTGERHKSYGDFSVSSILRQAGHVGGDLTGSFTINDRRFGVFGIDVSGHGVAAALLTARLATQFSASVDQNTALYIDEFGLYASRPPAALAQYLNHLMLTDLRTDTYFTLIYATINQVTGEVRLTQAGHPHPILQRADGTIKELGNGGLPIGVVEHATYEEITVTLEPGDRLLIASDGLSDATNYAGDVLGPDGISNILKSYQTVRGNALLEILIFSSLTYANSYCQDDISAILVERRPLESGDDIS